MSIEKNITSDEFARTSSHCVAISRKNDAEHAVYDLIAQIGDSVVQSMLIYYTSDYDVVRLQQLFKQHFPQIPFHGCSTCRGILTNQGFIEGPVIGLSYTLDPLYMPCNAITTFATTDRQEVCNKTTQAIDKTLKNSGREGEVPTLILMHSTVGSEEGVLECIDNYFGLQVPVLGGSAADDNITGKWSIFTQDDVVTQGTSLTFVYGNVNLNTSFGTGYVPTDNSGMVTSSRGRYLLTIDGKSAASTYRRWTKSILHDDQYQDLMQHTGHVPLGVQYTSSNNGTYFHLYHPVRLCDDGSIELFAEIPQGAKIKLMIGSHEHMVDRVSRIVGDASASLMSSKGPSAYISVFCAGSMYSILDHLPDIASQLDQAYNNVPFLCPFTFGEQGMTVEGKNAHGNLMISTVAFS
jgi:hypothetical protein